MNFYQSLNASTTAAIIAATGLAVLKYFSEPVGEMHPLYAASFAAFYLLFAVKSGLEDHRYFLDGHAPRSEQFFGILVALVSRILFTISAYSLRSPELVYLTMSLGFAVLSVWILVHVIRVHLSETLETGDRGVAERMRWFAWNIAYMAPGLSVISLHANPYVISPILPLLVSLDIFFSKTYRLPARNS